MDTGDDDVILNNNDDANNIISTLSERHEKTLDLSSSKMDDEKSTVESEKKINGQMMDCEDIKDDNNKHNQSDNCINTDAGNNKTNGINKTKCDESVSEAEPVGKRCKKSSSSNCTNKSSLSNDGANDVLSNQTYGNECENGSMNDLNDSSNSKSEDNATLNLSPDLNTNKDEPSCSSDKISSKSKSSKYRRLYRKSSDNDVQLDDNDDDNESESERRANTAMQCEESCEPSNSSRNNDTDNEPRRRSLDRNSESDDSLGVISHVRDDDSSEWTTASDDDADSPTPRVLSKEKPKPNFFIMPELIKREFGSNRFLHRKFYGSLHAVQRLELMYKMEEHDGCVNAINFNENGTLLASGSDDLRVVVWDWAIGRKRSSFETGHTSNIFEVKWLSIDYESLIVTCARDGQVRLLDVNKGEHRKLTTHHDEARRLAVHHDHPYEILSVGDDGRVLSMDIREEKPVRLMTVRDKGYHTSLYTIHINPRNSNEFCTGGRSETVKIFDRRRFPQPLMKLTPQNLVDVYITCAMYNYNGTEIVASYNDDDIYLFDTAIPHQSGAYAHKYEGHRNSTTVKCVNFFGPKSEFIVSGSDCSNIFFWDKNTEAIVQWMQGDEQGVVNRLEPHPYVPILATSGLDSDVKIWIPSCEHAPPMTNLEACVRSNIKYRNDKISHVPDSFDPQLLTVFLRHLTRYRSYRPFPNDRGTSRGRYFHVEVDSSSDSHSANSDSQSDTDGSDGPQCTTS